jgi:alpha-galactosidase
MERAWDFATGTWITASMYDKTNQQEWVKPNITLPMFRFSWLSDSAIPSFIYLSTYTDDDLGIAEPHLCTAVDLEYPHLHITIRLLTRIYPNTSLMRHELLARSSASSLSNESRLLLWNNDNEHQDSPSEAYEFQLDDNNKQAHSGPRDYIDFISLSELHCCWESISLLDVTDTHNNLVSKDSGLLYPNERRGVRGNIVLFRKSLHSCGLMTIKEGPTSLAHLQDPGEDFRFDGCGLTIAGSGVSLEDMLTDSWISAYGSAISFYDGSRYGAYELLNQYHRCIHRIRPDKDFYIMSNTWGDRSKDGRITEAFLQKELLAGAKLGIDIYQIDDGWQKGVTSNSVVGGGRWSDYHSDSDDFWSVHPERLPRGLEPVKELAASMGIQLGLWFSPDSSSDFANWEKDADTLLYYYGKHNIRYFKLDGINLKSKRGEARLVNMMRKIIRESNGQVTFNLDTTAQVRLGYFGKIQYGSLFLENRYTDWSNYYPHWTFRNLWSLAPYVPAQRLQMEFLNVYRNIERYQGDPLAPSECGLVYAFAMTIFSNPLAWMELTGLEAAPFECLRQAIEGLKPHHSSLLSGHLLPIGDEPTGASWTGMQSIASVHGGYLLVVRELNASPEASFKLWGVNTDVIQCRLMMKMNKRDEVITPRASEEEMIHITADDRGEYGFKLPNPLSFALYSYSYDSTFIVD